MENWVLSTQLTTLISDLEDDLDSLLAAYFALEMSKLAGEALRPIHQTDDYVDVIKIEALH